MIRCLYAKGNTNVNSSGKTRDGVIMLYCNATLHTNRQIQKLFQRYGWKLLQHPTQSPIWQPQTSSLWDPQTAFIGAAVGNNDDIVAVTAYLQALDRTSLRTASTVSPGTSTSTGMIIT
jgi:hypothetical protein